MSTKLDPHLIAVTDGKANPRQVYTDGDVRITVNAHICPDKPSEAIGEQMITEDSGERYVATSKAAVLGPVVYNIRVIGDAGEWDAVRDTLKKVLPCFEDKNLTAE